MTRILEWAKARWGDMPLYVTENGMAAADAADADGAVHDAARIDYLKSYIGAALDAWRRPSRRHRLVAARQLRMGRGLRQALRSHPRRLCDPRTHSERQFSMVCGACTKPAIEGLNDLGAGSPLAARRLRRAAAGATAAVRDDIPLGRTSGRRHRQFAILRRSRAANASAKRRKSWTSWASPPARRLPISVRGAATTR